MSTDSLYSALCEILPWELIFQMIESDIIIREIYTNNFDRMIELDIYSDLDRNCKDWLKAAQEHLDRNYIELRVTKENRRIYI